MDAHVVTLTSGRRLTVKELADQYQVCPWTRGAATLSNMQIARTNQRSAELIVKALQKFRDQ